ncbi:hypothetical protein HPB48_004164 [Haemaphysalis longicornis]|uniref:Uncharacterized protein n=1 Tax=Haemaphysalis longicornis TaxID=44386 RepID=A0A9J6FR54_HAELO|nr:hypothetical protein HPB48_004164 [Haemaphysalis longicornis]
MLTREIDHTFLIAAPSTIPKGFMVCTVNGEGPSLKKLVAPRSLCDIIFFDSVHKEVRKEMNATFNNSIMRFLNWPQLYPDGEFGFSYSVEKVFEPSLFISISHVSHDDRARKDCRIVPPTWLSLPNDEVSYGLSLISSCQLLSEVAEAGDYITLAVSFTLSGHMYKPKSDEPEDFQLFNPCENFDGNYYVPPYEVCAAKSVCQEVTFGVAAYDVEYDDQPRNLQCTEFGLVGPFGRVALLKKMNTYLTTLTAAAAFDEYECFRIEFL